MKQSSIATAFLAVGATAQNTSTATRTEYYNTCSLSTGGTVTDTVVSTYCPPCEVASMSTFPGGQLTTYTTSYSQVCPTGLEEATYTVTEPCPSTGLARGPSYVPQGFTVTTVPCSVCEAGKSQYAQTTPGPALASALAAPAAAPAVPTSGAEAGSAAPPAAAAPAGAPAAGAPAAAGVPAAAGSPGAAGSPAAAGAPSAADSPATAGAPAAAGAAGAASPANAENAAAAPGTAAPAENGTAAPAESGATAPAGSSAGAPSPYPLPSQAGQAAGAPASSGNGTVPFTGAANLLSVGISSFIAVLATLMTGFAFVL